MPLQPGLIIDGYELVAPLGVGGMGEVWKVRRAHEFFAIKFILPELRKLEGIVDRFKKEIQTAMRLTSPHSVRFQDFGVELEHGPYFVMELLTGESLRDLLAQGDVPVTTAVDYVLQATEALREAHHLGIVHRDLKPENLFLAKTDSGSLIKVLDFGIARISHDFQQLTQAGTFVGTRNYSSPEQFENAMLVTARSDIWSLGAILYELLCGLKAFPGEDLKPVSHILTTPPASLRMVRPGLPPGLMLVVERCLQRDPARRFADVVALRDALQGFGRDQADTEIGDAATQVAPPRVAGVDIQRVIPVGEWAGAPRSRSSKQPPQRRFAELDALIQALCAGRKRDGTQRRVVFMLGAGFSAPEIPKTAWFVDSIREKLPKNERATLEVLTRESGNLYQDAFSLLRGRQPAYHANEIVRRAVLQAYNGEVMLAASEAAQATQCSTLEDQHDRWRLPAGVDHLGAIIQAGLWRTQPRGLLRGAGDERFSGLHLTTNFDPLLAISVRKHGGIASAFSISNDVRLPKPNKQSCSIVHLHGRWDDGDTLHAELDHKRPALQDSLRELLNHSTLVVVGYGGWDDIFVRTLTELAAGEHDFEILWGFYELDQTKIELENEELIDRLTNALAPRITFYRGIDTNSLFRDLRAKIVPDSSIAAPAARHISSITPLPPEPPLSTLPPSERNDGYGKIAAVLSVGLVSLAVFWVWLVSRSGPAVPAVLLEPAPATSASQSVPAAPPTTFAATIEVAQRDGNCPKKLELRKGARDAWDTSFALGKDCTVSADLPLAFNGEVQVRLSFGVDRCISRGSFRDDHLSVPSCVPKKPAVICSYIASAEPIEITAWKSAECRKLKVKTSGTVQTQKLKCSCTVTRDDP